MTKLHVCILLALGTASACAEAVVGDDQFLASDAGAPSGNAGKSDAGRPDAGHGGTDGGTDFAVAINEIRAKGGDYIELYNAGSGPADLSGFGVSDSDGDKPKIDEAVRFPQGTTLAAGGFLLIVGDHDQIGPTTDCGEDGPPSCFEVTWKVSNSSGESVYFLSPDDDVLSEVYYGANAVESGFSYGRLPDGTGDFVATTPTPAAHNEAP